MSKDSDFNEERLGKLVQLAKNGVGGEKETALRMVKAICKKRGLDFDEVMNGKKVREYVLPYKTKEQEALLAQVICRYALMTHDADIKYNKWRKVMIFDTTAEKYFETVNAWNVLWPLYKKEKQKVARGFFYAYLDKHDLYYQPTPEERRKMRNKKESEDETKARQMGSAISLFMDNAEIHKTLPEGKK